MRYEVLLTATVQQTMIVEAENEDEAEAKADSLQPDPTAWVEFKTGDTYIKGDTVESITLLREDTDRR